MQQPGSQTWNGGAPISNGGAGHHWPSAGDGPARNPRGLTRPAQGSSSHFSGCDGKSVKRSFLCDIATDVDI